MASKEYIVSNVEPFTLYGLNSCYYHHLASIFIKNGEKPGLMLLNRKVRVGSRLSIEEAVYFTEAALCKALGYELVKERYSRGGLKRRICQDLPVILGVDSYEQPNRGDYFHREHSPHFILAYGYRADGSLEIIDHRFQNSNRYEKLRVALSQTERAIDMFNRLYRESGESCHAVVPGGGPRGVEVATMIGWHLSAVSEDGEAVRENLDLLTEELTPEADRGFYNRALNFLTQLRNDRMLLQFSLREDRPELADLLDRIVQQYNLSLGVVRRLFYLYDRELLSSKEEKIRNNFMSLRDSETQLAELAGGMSNEV